MQFNCADVHEPPTSVAGRRVSVCRCVVHGRIAISRVARKRQGRARMQRDPSRLAEFAPAYHQEPPIQSTREPSVQEL